MTIYNKRERITYIDLFRTIGIILMIMGHIKFGKTFDHFIHAFNMPIFFFASGWFFKSSSNIWKKIIHLSKTLLIPYIFFAGFHCLIGLIIYDTVDLKKIVMNTDGNGIIIAGALWFLTTLFISEVLYSIIDRFINNRIILTIIIIIIAITGNFYNIISSIRAPLGADASLVGIGFLHLGRCIGNSNEKKISKLKTLNNISTIVILIAVSSVLIFENGYVNMRTGEYSNISLFWITSVTMIIALLNCCRIVDGKIRDYRWYKLIINIGRDSIVYLCLNQLSILVSSSVLMCISLDIFTYKICTLVLCLIILEIFRRFFTLTKLKIIIGK